MNDVIYLALFIACCAATGGLIALCGRLMPTSAPSPPPPPEWDKP